jgi:ferredoxin
MKAHIDRDGCISCGLCASTCPEVFQLNEEDGLAEVIADEIPDGLEDTAVECQENCPTSVITVEE